MSDPLSEDLKEIAFGAAGGIAVGLAFVVVVTMGREIAQDVVRELFGSSGRTSST